MARNASLERFLAKLRQATPQIAADMLEATREGAEDIAAIMRRAVPKKSGNLARSIRIEQGKRGKWLIKAGGDATRRPVRKGGPDYDYSMAVEFGTRPHFPGGLAGGARHPGSKPRPFFWPSYRLRKKPVKSAITRKVKRSLQQRLGAT